MGLKARPARAIPELAKGRPQTYPWETMGIGESFLHRSPNMRSVRRACWRAGMQYHKRYAARREGDGIYVYRIEPIIQEGA